MALHSDRRILDSDGTYILNDVASKGVFLCFSTAGSGSSMGEQRGVVQLAASPSGLKVAGCLLQDFVNLNLTRFHLNWNKEEQQIGDFCEFATKGWVTTNALKSGDAPSAGDPAYLTANGEVTKTVSTTGGIVATPLVGRFDGLKDESGYVRVSFNLP